MVVVVLAFAQVLFRVQETGLLFSPAQINLCDCSDLMSSLLPAPVFQRCPRFPSLVVVLQCVQTEQNSLSVDVCLQCFFLNVDRCAAYTLKSGVTFTFQRASLNEEATAGEAIDCH